MDRKSFGVFGCVLSLCFGFVSSVVPASVPLTSFSILFSRLKGDFDLFLNSTPKIDALQEGDKVLILESCSHSVNICDDIGRVKLPAWLQKKTGKKHRCGLPKDLLAAIRAQAGEVWAFPGGKPGNHKTRQAVWKDVKRAAKAFRLPQNIGTHSFRKVYAVRLREKYGSIEKVRRALSHSSLAVTALYAMADQLLSDKQQLRERRRAQRGR